MKQLAHGFPLPVLGCFGFGESERLYSISSKEQFAIETMIQSKALETLRLVLRPLTVDDAPAIARLAGRREIADTTLAIPHPYSEEQARVWLSSQAVADNTKPRHIVFAATLKPDGQLIGAIGLHNVDLEHALAEMGFWIGVEFWGRGYATEGAARVIRFGFEELNLNRVFANHMVRNPASGRVLEKVGMKREGLLRQRVRKWGVFEDIILLATLRQDWASKSF